VSKSEKKLVVVALVMEALVPTKLVMVAESRERPVTEALLRSREPETVVVPEIVVVPLMMVSPPRVVLVAYTGPARVVVPETLRLVAVVVARVVLPVTVRLGRVVRLIVVVAPVSSM
jgi:hypothetical protein